MFRNRLKDFLVMLVSVVIGFGVNQLPINEEAQDDIEEIATKAAEKVILEHL